MITAKIRHIFVFAASLFNILNASYSSAEATKPTEPSIPLEIAALLDSTVSLSNVDNITAIFPIQLNPKKLRSPTGSEEEYFEAYSPTAPRYNLVFSRGSISLVFEHQNTPIQNTSGPPPQSPHCLSSEMILSIAKKYWRKEHDYSVLGYRNVELSRGRQHLSLSFYTNSGCARELIVYENFEKENK